MTINDLSRFQVPEVPKNKLLQEMSPLIFFSILSLSWDNLPFKETKLETWSLRKIVFCSWVCSIIKANSFSNSEESMPMYVPLNCGKYFCSPKGKVRTRVEKNKGWILLISRAEFIACC